MNLQPIPLRSFTPGVVLVSLTGPGSGLRGFRAVCQRHHLYYSVNNQRHLGADEFFFFPCCFSEEGPLNVSEGKRTPS